MASNCLRYIADCYIIVISLFLFVGYKIWYGTLFILKRSTAMNVNTINKDTMTNDGRNHLDICRNDHNKKETDVRAFFPQEHWMQHGGRTSRAFRIEESPYERKHIQSVVRAYVRGVLKCRRVPGGYEFLCIYEVPLPTLAKLSEDLLAIVSTCSLRHGLSRNFR